MNIAARFFTAHRHGFTAVSTTAVAGSVPDYCSKPKGKIQIIIIIANVQYARKNSI